MAIVSKTQDPISKIAMTKKWVGFDFPTESLAQDANMSLEEIPGTSSTASSSAIGTLTNSTSSDSSGSSSSY